MRFLQLVLTVLAGLFLMVSVGLAEEQLVRKGFWGAVDLGVGLLQQSVDEIEEDDTTFYLGLKGGYTINPYLRLGLEFSGWLLQASNPEDPSVGEGVSQAFLIARYYPVKKSNAFAKVGGGYVSIWNNRPGEPARKTGWGLTVGGGYDIPIVQSFAISPFVSFSSGNADDLDYRAVTFSVSFLLHQ